MGLTRGTKIRLTKVAPMGDPVEIDVRDFSLSLRKDEARVLLLERNGAEAEASSDASDRQAES
jgi:ferrous iron transport protein A